MSADGLKIVPQAYRLSARFNYVIFPLDLSRLIIALQSIGYIPLAPIPPISAGIIGRSQGSGLIASKGNSLIDVNSERQFIGVQDSDNEITKERFKEITTLLESPELLGNQMKIWFYEFQARLQYWPKSDGLGILGRISSGIPLLAAWGAILPSPPALHHLRVSPREQSIESPNYYDVIFEPNITCPKECYDILLVLRNQDMKKVESFVSEIKSITDKLTIALEGETQQ